MEIDTCTDYLKSDIEDILISDTEFFLENFNEETFAIKELNVLLRKLIDLHKGKQSNADLIKTIFNNMSFKNEKEKLYELFKETINICRTIHSDKSLDFSQFSFFKENNFPIDLFYIFDENLEEFIERILKELLPEDKENDFSHSCLKDFQNFIENIFFSTWLEKFVTVETDRKKIRNRFNDVWLKQKLFNMRKSKFFSMLVFFPDSSSALEDMRYCFTCVSVKIKAIEFLIKEIQHRLTHTGVHTDEILVSYESIILSLRFVDPTYVSQVVVCKPIAEYLRTRPDAIKCIVERIWDWFSSTFSESSEKEKMETSSLKSESIPNSFSNHDLNSTSQNAVDSEDEFVYVDHHFVIKPNERNKNFLKLRQSFHDKWSPEPIESVCLASQLANRNLDMLSTMMSIYESKKDFLSEYMKQLANHLLKFTSFEDQRILFSKQLKLFKYRFSVLDLHFCDVMLQDVENSEDWFRQFKAHNEMNQKASQTEEAFPLKTLVISSFYWPELLDDNFIIPDDLLEPFKQYSSFFETQNEEMCIKWLCRYGTVEVDIKLPNGKVVPYTLEPIEASIAHLFTKKAKYSLAELSSELKAFNLSTVKRALKFFLNNGILKMKKIANVKATNIMEAANSEIYEISDNRFVSDDDKNCNDKDMNMNENDNCGSDPNTNNDQGVGQNEEHSIEEDNEVEEIELQRTEKDNQVYWSYINGMLMNLGALSLDKILSMLKIFTSAADESNGPINKASLQAFLNKKIIENEISLEGGLYRLVKK